MRQADLSIGKVRRRCALSLFLLQRCSQRKEWPLRKAQVLASLQRAMEEKSLQDQRRHLVKAVKFNLEDKDDKECQSSERVRAPGRSYYPR